MRCGLQDDPDIPFTEDDYRRRKPHPNFKEHISAEKTVIKLGKTVSVFGVASSKKAWLPFFYSRVLLFSFFLSWNYYCCPVSTCSVFVIYPPSVNGFCLLWGGGGEANCYVVEC